MKGALHPRVRLAALVGLAAACARADGRSSRPILFQSQAPGGTEDLRTLDPVTGQSTLVLSGDSISARGLPTWDPSSTRIAYVREFGSRDELYVLSPGSGVNRRIGEGLPSAVMFPDWSPDGRKLAVSAGDSPDRPGVFLVDVATGLGRVIRRDAESYRCPSWAPNGDRIVVAAYREGRSALVVIDAEGAVLDTLLRSDSTYLDCPQWSPRGNDVLFTVFHGSGLSGWERPAFHSNLAVLDLTTREVRQLTSDRGLTNYGRWSRDGDWIVYQSDRLSPPTVDEAHAPEMLQHLEIFVMQRDGTGIRRLTHNAYFDAHPSW
jgi:Tol biopolymer transport system component